MTRRSPDVVRFQLPGYIDVSIRDIVQQRDDAVELAKRIYANAADPNATVEDLENIPTWVTEVSES